MNWGCRTSFLFYGSHFLNCHQEYSLRQAFLYDYVRHSLFLVWWIVTLSDKSVIFTGWKPDILPLPESLTLFRIIRKHEWIMVRGRFWAKCRTALPPSLELISVSLEKNWLIHKRKGHAVNVTIVPRVSASLKFTEEPICRKITLPLSKPRRCYCQIIRWICPNGRWSPVINTLPTKPTGTRWKLWWVMPRQRWKSQIGRASCRERV